MNNLKKNEFPHKRIFLIGGRGRLGTSIKKIFNNEDLIVLERRIYEEWFRPEKINDIRSVLNINPSKSEDIIMVLSGAMNPKEDREHLFNVNYELPKNIIKANEGSNNKIVTFGTIMEDLSPEANNYIASKKKLSKFIDNTSAKTLSVKIHTLYGGEAPNPFMFLGQIFHSLKNNIDFKMSSGDQLREYHHIDDDSKAIMELLRQDLTGKEVISHGEAISLKDLAKIIFKKFDMVDNLKIGSLPDRIKENYDIYFAKNPLLNNVVFRDTADGVTKYLKEFLHKNL